MGPDGDNREAVLALGEAKWHETMGMRHLDRLRRMCFSGAGFTSELRDEAARTGDVRLLTSADLYAGVLLPQLRLRRERGAQPRERRGVPVLRRPCVADDQPRALRVRAERVFAQATQCNPVPLARLNGTEFPVRSC